MAPNEEDTLATLGQRFHQSFHVLGLVALTLGNLVSSMLNSSFLALASVNTVERRTKVAPEGIDLIDQRQEGSQITEPRERYSKGWISLFSQSARRGC